MINAQENKTKALRQWRFSSFEQIIADTETIREYIKEAILNQNQDKSIKPDRHKPLFIPKQLGSFLSRDKKLKQSFGALSKSKQRDYSEYITEAKREETKLKRLDKIAPMILQGMGLNDKYKR